MKNIILSISLYFIVSCLLAQTAYQQLNSLTPNTQYSLCANGQKLVYYNNISSNLSTYTTQVGVTINKPVYGNMGSSFQNLNFIVPWYTQQSYLSFEPSISLSVGLYSTDGQIAANIWGVDSITGVYDCRIIKQDGTVLFSCDSCIAQPTYVTYGATIDSPILVVTQYHYNSVGVYSAYQNILYALPGNLCTTCQHDCNSTSGIIGPRQNNSESLEIFPNPSTKQATVNYHLPEGINEGEITIFTWEGQIIRKIRVSGSTGSLLDNVEPAGTYIYLLSTTDGDIVRKQIIIH